MAIKGVDTKCYILALFVRDDGERFLLGSGHYEFKDTQMHFAANAIQNDIVEVQGNDGFLLAGQVRRPGTQSFDGYVGDGTMGKEETESYRRQFFSFFRKNFFYKVIYVFSDGTAIQRKSGFLVDDPTVEELYQMYPEYHVALNFEDVNYYSYSEDEEGQEQYAKEATIDTSSMRATGGLVWDNIGVVWEDTQWGGEQTASGTEITVQNEMNVSSIVDDIRLYGDTEQQTYSGKNLWSFDDGTFTNNSGSSQTQTHTDTTLTLTAVGTTGAQFITWITPELDSTKTYTISGKAKKIVKGTDGQPYIRVTYSYSDDGSTWSSNSNAYNNTSVTQGEEYSFSYTLPSGHKYYRLRCYNNTGTPVTIGENTTYYDLQLEANTIATAFEPYVGGIPSPNPDYQQEVYTVTGEQAVTVTGKNLFSGYTKGINLNPVNGSQTTSSVSACSDYIPIDITGTKEAVISGLPNNLYNFVAAYNSDKVFLGRTGAGNTSERLLNVSAFSGGTPQGTGDIAFLRVPVYQNSNVPGVIDDIDNANIQLEKGSTASPFEQYHAQIYPISLGNIELCKIGDYQDYIYKSGDDWYVHKEIGKVVFNGTETWGQVNSYAYFSTTINTDLIKPSNIYSLPLILSNYYSPASRSNLYDSTVDYGIGIHENTPNRILIRNKDYTSIPAFTTWLSNHNTTVYYPLATPTDTQITDNTLIGQLNALDAMKLFIGENNLAIQATETNLPASLSFKYYTTVAMTGAEWEEGGSGGATVVEVDSITNTYPIWRVKGPAVNPQLSVINTNTTIRYTGTVTSTQTLEIDMFNKTAKLNGVSVIGNVSGDWVSLAPGTNRVIYTAENADAQPSTIEWQEVVG